jgi:hypothetical protein
MERIIKDINTIIAKTKSSQTATKAKELNINASELLEYIKQRKVLIHSDKEEFSNQYNRYQQHLELKRKEEEMKQRQRQHEEAMRQRQIHHEEEIKLQKEKLVQQQQALIQQQTLIQQQQIEQHTIISTHNEQHTTQTIILNNSIENSVNEEQSTQTDPLESNALTDLFEPNALLDTAEAEVTNIPTYSEELSDQENKMDCPICLEELVEDTTYKTPCGHSFHETCLKKWKETYAEGKQPTCPYCRGNI